MSARDTVLAGIRRALGVSGDDTARQRAVDDRLDWRPTGVIPARGQLPREERIAMFVTMVEKANATVARVADADAIPAAVAGYLRDCNDPAAIRTGADPMFANLDWQATQVAVAHGPAEETDQVSLSRAEAGIAEAGTVVLTSGDANPTTLNFMPEAQIVAVRADDVVGDYEAAWTLLRARFGDRLPRAVNLIAGPSRSGDIEQTILLGAHGPRRLHVIVVG